jgi:hypothetical protein
MGPVPEFGLPSWDLEQGLRANLAASMYDLTALISITGKQPCIESNKIINPNKGRSEFMT